jgi:hypothetical protein
MSGRALAAMALLVWAIALSAHGGEYGVTVLRANLPRLGEDYFLNADIDYRFSPAVIEALEQGIPLTLELDLTIHAARDYWFDQPIFSRQRRVQLRYHPLAESFQVMDLDSGAIQPFMGLSILLETVSHVRKWQVTPEVELDESENYRARFSVSLDIESLPLPLRIEAYLSPDWYLKSPPFEWHVEP